MRLHRMKNIFKSNNCIQTHPYLKKKPVILFMTGFLYSFNDISSYNIYHTLLYLYLYIVGRLELS